MKIIDLEAHFNIQKYNEFLSNKELLIPGPRGPSRINDCLLDMGKERLKTMDTTGIDIQVLSQSVGVQILEPSEGTAWSKRVNNELSDVIDKYPDRFIGLASIAPQSPDEAAGELERAIMELGLKGLCILSHARDEYLDNKKYWVIFEMAEKLDVPIYLHPAIPAKGILQPYTDYQLSGPALGFAADLALHSMRMIQSGLFDRYPGLKIILGHMGEGLPYWLPRLDFSWTEPHKSDNQTIAKKPSEYIKSNFFITTSGMFFQPAFICAYLALGADKIMFAIDYPYEDTDKALQFMSGAPISDVDKAKIYHTNAESLFKL